MATFRSVLNGLVTRIDAQMTYLATCRVYAGEVEDLVDGMPFDQAPAVFVLFDGMDADDAAEGFGDLIFRARYSLAVIAKGLDGRTDTAETDTHSAHDMIEEVLAAIVENDLGITGFSGVAPTSVRRFRVTGNAAIYVVECIGTVSVSK